MNTLVHSINLRGIQNSFDPSIGVERKLYELKDPEHDKILGIISHCDGLLLCATKDKTRLVVWNPCTGQTRWIQIKNVFKNNPQLILLVSLKSMSSTLIHGEFLMTSLLFVIRSNGVNLKGNAYFVASDKESKFILKFDFTTERFLRLSFPSQNDDQIAVLSVVRQEKLALLQQRFDTYSIKMNIWVTKTKIDADKDLSWSNFLVVDFGKVTLTSEPLSFLVDEENKMVVCSSKIRHIERKTIIYFAKEGIQVHQEIAQKPKGCCSFLVSYVPSLVQF
ncbi:putative F-box protein [Arabidopsis thaliana]